MSFDPENGLAAVREGSKWGFIDTSGKIVINPQFDDVVKRCPQD